jgi:hypothetical protein
MRRLDYLVAVLAICCTAALASCSQKEQNAISNVKPPAPGTPASNGDVSGIYRSINQGVLQLRKDGDFTLVVPGGGASAGTFTLTTGRMAIESDDCGRTVGRYSVEVTGKQEAGKATLHMTTVDDGCDKRKRELTSAPWVYADS